MEQLQKAPAASPSGGEAKSTTNRKSTAQKPVHSLNHAQKMSQVYTKLRREGRGRRDMKDVRKRVQEFLNEKEREQSSWRFNDVFEYDYHLFNPCVSRL